MVPGNPLEHALVAAATEASAQPLFYRLLLESPLLMLDASEAPPPLEAEQTVLSQGTQVQALCVELYGLPHTAIFSSLVVLQNFVQAEHKYISMIGRDLLQLVRGSHLVLNPGADYGKQILPHEIEAILNGSITDGYSTLTVEKDTKVVLGQPVHFPTHITDALCSVFRSHKNVRAAYLALCAYPETGEEHLMVGVAATGDWRALMRDVSMALKVSARPKEIVDFVKMDDSSSAQYLYGTRPFYKKKLFGLF